MGLGLGIVMNAYHVKKLTKITRFLNDFCFYLNSWLLNKILTE